jgi:hypothetical protein
MMYSSSLCTVLSSQKCVRSDSFFAPEYLQALGCATALARLSCGPPRPSWSLAQCPKLPTYLQGTFCSLIYDADDSVPQVLRHLGRPSAYYRSRRVICATFQFRQFIRNHSDLHLRFYRHVLSRGPTLQNPKQKNIPHFHPASLFCPPVSNHRHFWDCDGAVQTTSKGKLHL